MSTFTSIVKKSIAYCTWVIVSCFALQAQEQLTNIPTFYINTDGGVAITSKENYVTGTLTVKSSDETEVLDNVVTEIRGRGNSTWNMPKKPYRIKLDKKTHLLGLPAKAKNWVLLANYVDKTLIRNAVALKISTLVGLEFSPSARFVDVVLNGEYQGNYMVSDQVQVAGSYRVPIEEQALDAVALPDISGGYLLEIDGFAASEPVWFTTPQGLKITVKYPKDDEINNAQLNYITTYVHDFENILFSSNYADPENGYRAFVDTTTLVNWYIACELTGNSDSFWSTYIYKKHMDDKLYFGPMWDYDIAFNNDNRLDDATTKLMRDYAHNPRTWVQRFWTDDWFITAVNKRWKELVAAGIEEALLEYIDETASLIDESQKRNFNKWNILPWRVYKETFLFYSYAEGVDYLKSYVSSRIDFLTESFEAAAPALPSEPFVAEDYYYMIMNFKSKNVIQVTDNSLALNSPLYLWTPDANDDSDDGQLWTIANLGDNLFRIVNKNSGYAMAGNGRGSNLIQKEINNNDASQKWNILPVFTGNIYGIVNSSTGYSINNSGGSSVPGTAVIEWDNAIYQQSKQNQHWYFLKMDKVATGINVGNHFQDLRFNVMAGALYLWNLPENAEVDIVNIQGVTVGSYRNAVDGNAMPLPTSGVYIVKVKSGSNIRYVKINRVN
ncbi:T9SS C-terminal target domain-containing protein [Dysgonomonas sp. 216]|uniref:CotH kinase family protein n=1 Tax=Dysgonomonas sp. 216 TaxID=2302934 RepID=UPI0013D8A6B4|nr:CotH kinase family protein [Dysgonomonas sp. 216]NDW19693.1 T9SS C-terminal target domain-containing protein [Dysgonomonas sp. 216]